LRRRLEAAEAEGYVEKADPVFPTTTGTPYRKSNLHRRWWAPLLAKAELPRIRIHDIRHSAASLSRLAGTDPKTISVKLGHENPAFTMRVYAHAVEALHRKDADALDILLDCRSDGRRGVQACRIEARSVRQFSSYWRSRRLSWRKK